VHPVLGYLPQHVWEASSIILGAAFAAVGLLHLVTGRVGAEDRYKPRLVRAAGAAQIAFGAGVAVLGFVVDAEPPGERTHDYWGGVRAVMTLIVWSAIVAGITVSVLRQRRRR
jgi:hypothetical protein